MKAGSALSYDKGATEKPLIEMTVGSFLDDIVSKQGDGEALVSRHQRLRYTYAQLNDKVNELAVALYDGHDYVITQQWSSELK